ncbi:unnamed protein product [Heligmosomoides polygyrus]|uniref:DAZ-associated protein 2 n=1 Tax=Heligmosomoides polygyrus TaxID=6339 RepID=A0A183GJM7_HELPZ|nr:unnamed protein product [Heligmosomoides polygyrus]
MTSNWEATAYSGQNQVQSAVHSRAVRGRGIVWNNGNGGRVFRTQQGMPVVETTSRHANHPGYRIMSTPRAQNFGVPTPVVPPVTSTGAQYSSEYPAQGQGQYMIVPGKQSAPATYPCDAALQGGVGYFPTQFNVANYGNAPATLKGPNILKSSAAMERSRQPYTPVITKPEVAPVPPTRHVNDYFVTEMDDQHLLQFEVRLHVFGGVFCLVLV